MRNALCHELSASVLALVTVLGVAVEAGAQAWWWSTPWPTTVTVTQHGYNLLNQYQFREALAAFNEVLRVDPGSAEALVGQGHALSALGDLEGARQAYEAAVRGPASRWPDLRVLTAELSLAQGDLGRADRALREELTLYPSSPAAHSYVGTLLLLQNRYAEARQWMGHAVRVDPQVAGRRYAMGAFLYSQGQLRRAWNEFRSVIELNPRFAAAYYALGSIYERHGMTGPALTAYQTYLTLDPASEWGLRAQQRVAALGSQAAAPPAGALDPSGYPTWLRGARVPAGDPVSVAPGPAPVVPGPETARPIGTPPPAAESGACVGLSNDPVQLQTVMLENYRNFVEKQRTVGPTAPETMEAWARYKCAWEALNRLRGTAQPRPER